MKWVIATICEWTDILHGPIGPLNGPISYTRTADKKTTYSTFCRAIEFRADDTHSYKIVKHLNGKLKTIILRSDLFLWVSWSPHFTKNDSFGFSSSFSHMFSPNMVSLKDHLLPKDSSSLRLIQLNCPHSFILSFCLNSRFSFLHWFD